MLREVTPAGFVTYDRAGPLVVVNHVTANPLQSLAYAGGLVVVMIDVAMIATREPDDRVARPVACNAAAAACEGEIIVIVEDQLEPRPDFLERLVAPFASDARLGSAAALLLAPGERQIDSAGISADTTLAAFPRLRGRPAASARSVRPLLLGPAGAAAAVRRAAWEQVGGMDELLPGGLEDLDLALRLRAAGWKTTLAYGAVAVNRGAARNSRRAAYMTPWSCLRERASGWARKSPAGSVRALSVCLRDSLGSR